jgi:hypothetical protein
MLDNFRGNVGKQIVDKLLSPDAILGDHISVHSGKAIP